MKFDIIPDAPPDNPPAACRFRWRGSGPGYNWAESNFYYGIISVELTLFYIPENQSRPSSAS